MRYSAIYSSNVYWLTIYQINKLELTSLENQRLWLNCDYGEILRSKVNNVDDIENVDTKIFFMSTRYGEIMLPEYDSDKKLMYSDQFGLVLFE